MKSLFRPVLTIVDAMISGGVQNHVGPHIHQDRASAGKIRNVDFVASQGYDVVSFQGYLQVTSELSVGSKECDLHRDQKR